jgi:DnaJ-class molecular chaperone
MEEKIKTHVTCGHCKGDGVCKNVTYNTDYKKSCATCLSDAKFNTGSYHIVKCSICYGTGWVRLQ